MSSPATQAAHDAVLLAVDALSQACIQPDAAALEALTLPALSYGHTDGRQQTREEFITALVEKRSVIRGIELNEMSVQLAGDAALVRHHAIYQTFSGGVAGVSDIQVCQVWQLTDGAWKLGLRDARKTRP